MKNKGRKWISLLITALMFISTLVLPVYAAFSNDLSAFSVSGITAAATSSGDATAKANSANAVYLKANAGTYGTKYVQLTLTAEAEGTLTFDYDVTYAYSLKINNASASTSSTTGCSYALNAGDSVIIYLQPRNTLQGGKIDGEITVKNISFEYANSLSVYFNTPIGSGASGVSYTVNDTAVSANNTSVSLTNETTMTAEFSNLPNGYTVREWRLSDGTPYDDVSSDLLTVNRPADSITLTPVIEKSGVPIYMVNGTQYYDWETAFQTAGANGTVILSGNGTLPTTLTDDEVGDYAKMVDGKAVYTIGEGQTLLLPRVAGETEIKGEDADLPYANYALWNEDSRWKMQPSKNRYLLLTIPSGVTVNNNGCMVLGGSIAANIAYFNGATLSQDTTVEGHTHSDIALNGTLNMGDNSILSSIGYITGSGTVNATGSGAKIYQPFVVNDYRGGNYAVGAAGKYGTLDYSVDTGVSGSEDIVAPFLRYTMQNIQATININAGNYMLAYCDLWADDSHNLTTAVIIGDSENAGLLNLAENASITAKYLGTNKVNHYDAFKDGDTSDGTRGGYTGWGYDQIGRTKLTITGGASLGSLDLIVNYVGNEMQVSMSTVTFPVPYNYDIYLNSGEYNVPYSMMLLPGASMTVGTNATLNITGSGNRFMVMDGLFDHTQSGDRLTTVESPYEYTISHTYPKTGELQTAGLSGTAELKLNGGKLVVGSGVKFGGLVQTNGSANSQVTFNGTSGCDIRVGLVGSNDMYYYWAGATTRTLPARLMNGAGEYVEMTAGSVYKAAEDSDNVIDSYTFDLYTTSANKTPTEYTEVSGKVCDNCATCQLAYGSEAARCVCNIFSDISVSGMWYDYTLTVVEGEISTVYYHLDNKLYTADSEVTTHTIADGSTAEVTSGSGVEVTTEGATLTFSNVALTENTVVTVTEAAHEHSYTASTVEFSEDFTTYTVTVGCEDCPEGTEGKTLTSEQQESSVEEIVGDCQTKSNTTYTASGTYEGVDYEEIKSVEGDYGSHTMTHHAAVAPGCETDGTVEYWSCSVCKKNFSDENGTTELTSIVDAALGHSGTLVPGQAATCGVNGWKDYYDCDNCDKIFSDADCKNEITDLDAWKTDEGKIAASGEHNYVAGEEDYEWSEDYSTCTVTGTCSVCQATTTETAEVEVKTNEPTCAEAGSTTYKVSFSASWASAQEKSEAIAASGCSYNAAVTAPTCTEKGYTTYTCSVCGGSYVSDYVDAKGHSYGEPTFNWTTSTTSASCTATFTCTVCSDEENRVVTETCTVVEKSRIDATCGADGSVTYTATITFNGKTYAEDSNAVVISATGEHSYGAPVFTWNGYECTAKVVCNCGHEQSVDVTVTSAVTTTATCTVKGVETYTATAVYNEVTYTSDEHPTKDLGLNSSNHVNTKDVAEQAATCTEIGYTAGTYCEDCQTWISGHEVIDAKEHSWTVSYTWSDDGKTCTATRTCGNDANHNETESVTASGTVKTAATCLAKGWTTYTAEFIADWAETQTKDVEDIAQLSHSYTGDWTYTSEGHAQKCVNGCGEANPELSDHSYSTKVTEPTFDAQGYTTYTCSCGYSYMGDYVDALVAVAQIGTTKYETLTEAMEAAVSGNTVTLLTDVTVNAEIATISTSAGQAYTAVEVTEGITLDGNGYTLTVTGADGHTWSSGVYMTGGTLKNLTVVGGKRGVLINCPTEDVTIDGVSVSNSLYALNTNSKGPNGPVKLTVTNATFNGWSSISNASISKATFEKCTFGKSSRGGELTDYAYFRPYCDTILTDCTFSEDFEINIGSVDATITADADLNITSGVDDYMVVYEAGTYSLKEIVAKIGDVEYASLTEAVDAAKSGDTITLLIGGEYSDAIVLGDGVTLDLNGQTIQATVIGTISMNGGTLITAEGYKMAGPDADYYQTSDAVFTVYAPTESQTLGDITIVSGTMTVVPETWWTGAGQTLTIAKDATFVIPEGKTMNVLSTVVVKGAATINGTLNLYSEDATVEASADLNITTTAGDCVLYVDGVYKVHSHTEVVDVAVAATCTATGLTEGKHCSVCNEVLVAQTVVPATGHTEVVDAAVAATCTATGLTEGKHCSVCNEVLVAQTVVDALGHKEGEAATCTTAQTCTVCGTVLQEALNHEGTETTVTYEAVESEQKHSVITTCECGEVIATTTDDCADEDGDGSCDKCGQALGYTVNFVNYTKAGTDEDVNYLATVKVGDTTVTGDPGVTVEATLGADGKFTVSCVWACVVLVETTNQDNTKSYDKLTAVSTDSENTYEFTVETPSNGMVIIVVHNGDVNADGAVNTGDRVSIARSIYNGTTPNLYKALSAMGEKIADVNFDGNVNTGDRVSVARSIYNGTTPNLYKALGWVKQ